MGRRLLAALLSNRGVPRLVPTASWPQGATQNFTILIEFELNKGFSTVQFIFSVRTLDGYGYALAYNGSTLSVLVDDGSTTAIPNEFLPDDGPAQVLVKVNRGGGLYTFNWLFNDSTVASGSHLISFGPLLFDYAGVCANIDGVSYPTEKPATKFKILNGTGYTTFAEADAVTGPDLIFNGLNF